MRYCVRNIFKSRCVSEIFQPWVKAVSVGVGNFLVAWAWPNKGKHYKPVNSAELFASFFRQHYGRVTICSRFCR